MTPYYKNFPIEIYHGDCWDHFKQFSDIDLIVADPPYGARRPSARRSASERFKEVKGNGAVDTLWLALAYRCLKETGAIYLFTCWDVMDQWRNAMVDVGFLVRSCIVWDKGVHGLADLETCYAPRHELILFAAKGRHVLRGDRPVDIIRVNRVDPGKLSHPYQKPVSLLARLIGSSTDAGNVVMDPFMGVGSTLQAAKDMGRRAIGIEVEERYCETAVKRLRKGFTFPMATKGNK